MIISLRNTQQKSGVTGSIFAEQLCKHSQRTETASPSENTKTIIIFLWHYVNYEQRFHQLIAQILGLGTKQ
mgnify:CR=1 FL=1